MMTVVRKLCLNLLLISTVLTLEIDLTLRKIYPCSGVYNETVSRFKTDVYAVIPSFRYCDSSLSDVTVVSHLAS